MALGLKVLLVSGCFLAISVIMGLIGKSMTDHNG